MTEVSEMLEKPAEDSRPIWKTKTFWTGVITTAVVPLVPGAKEWVQENPEAFVALLSSLFVALRKVSKGKVTIK